MPQIAQLDLVYLSQWFWLLLVLGTIYFFVGRGIVPRVEATVDERDAKIAADLAEAERLRTEADAAEEAWRTRVNAAHSDAKDAIAEAKAKGAAESEKRLAAVDKRLAGKIEKAAASLEESRRAALTEIEDAAAEAASEIVAKLTGARVATTAARQAVSGAMSRA